MSESPERPRMTRRQLREMEQARQAAEAQSQGVEQASSAAEASGDFAVPPPTRPTMTRRQLREAAQREAEERAAQERAAEEAQRQAAEARRATEARRAAEERAAQEQTAPQVQQRRSVADARRSVLPNVGEQPQGQQRPGFYPAPQNWQEERPQQWTPGAGPSVQSGPAAAPNVRPPAGVNAIRTVEETGELSPILHTAPGENVWPSIPGAEPEQSEAKAEPDPVTPASPAVPFRAPAWGARTSAATQGAPDTDVEEGAPPTVAPRVNTQRAPETGGVSGMSATPTRWPAAGGSTTHVGPPSGSVFPGAPSAGTQIPSPQLDDDEDEDEEEYEPMFTWLRLLVLMIIAFVLGALVWVIIGQSDAGAAATAMAAITGLKIPLGE